jgi:hypothetical protein
VTDGIGGYEAAQVGFAGYFQNVVELRIRKVGRNFEQQRMRRGLGWLRACTCCNSSISGFFSCSWRRLGEFTLPPRPAPQSQQRNRQRRARWGGLLLPMLPPMMNWRLRLWASGCYVLLACLACLVLK